MKTVEERILTVLKNVVGIYGVPKDVDGDARLTEVFGLDSLDEIELVMALEAEFDIEITDEEALGLSTLGKVIAYLASKGISDTPIVAAINQDLYVMVFPSQLHTSGFAAGVFTDPTEAATYATKFNGTVHPIFKK